MSEEPTILYEVDGGVAVVTMNRPKQRNAENSQMITERAEAFDRAEQDPDVRAVLLVGAGPTFCAGHDLKEYSDEAWRETNRGTVGQTWNYERSHYFDASLRIRDFPKPTIAAVQGHCIAGGFMTAAMCDLIIVAEDAQFMDPTLGLEFRAESGETVSGAAPGVEVLFHPWQLGIRKAKEMLFTGVGMSAEEAVQCGFANRVVPNDQLGDAALQMAQTIASRDPIRLGMIKRSIQHGLDLSGQDAALEFNFLIHQMSHSIDARGGT